jgi:succinate-semialdehyde dehydrogenase/glutarate-semialdehyde dehydrogenase
MLVHAEETFGPVVAVHSYGDVSKALRMARKIESGTVNINESYSSAWGSVDAPMGGRKDSGTGRRHGPEGLLKFTESQTVAVQKGVALDLSAPWLRKPGARAAALMVLRRFRPGASRR